ncbi:uncharacterized protein LOC128550575 [Mercenaria mercenaria]|uniref:uncharacterized protein LOC128550575 n=1 Tax=Mercenaria mercenaria TaxID=6596 RepID=UPI00234F43E9|nr:uncharacterized protein LOC128550575 [Mercenaria mercenaria]
MLFADATALASHSHDGLQRLLDRFSNTCLEFALIICIKKTEIIAQGAPIPPSISINGSQLANVDNFRYLGSLISKNFSLDAEINARVGKAIGGKSKLTKRVWDNKNLALNRKKKV